MNDMAALLHAFGFSTKTSQKIARRALQNALTIEDVKAWIDETRTSTTILNPLGFVRTRLQSGDKLSTAAPGERHHSITRTCPCGRVCAITVFCDDCALCPHCCQCYPQQGEP